MKKCAIFAGGDVPERSTEWLLRMLEETDLVICADCGYNHAKRLGIVPNIIVGDFDSYTDELPSGIEILQSVPDKDDTDTLMAVKHAIELGYSNIDLYGGIGGTRFEHSFANIQTMIYAYQQGCTLNMYGDSDLMIQGADDGDVIYRNRGNGVYMSVFALSESVGIDYLRGVKYPLEDYCMVQSFPIGVSNEITEKTAKLRINNGLALIIITNK